MPPWWSLFFLAVLIGVGIILTPALAIRVPDEPAFCDRTDLA